MEISGEYLEAVCTDSHMTVQEFTKCLLFNVAESYHWHA
jgi:hypothetical protein